MGDSLGAAAAIVAFSNFVVPIGYWFSQKPILYLNLSVCFLSIKFLRIERLYFIVWMSNFVSHKNTSHSATQHIEHGSNRWATKGDAGRRPYS
jgi:hypothetical protein